MNVSLPVVLNNRVGCADDLIVNDSNGYIVPFGDINELSNKIQRLIFDEPKMRQAAVYSHRHIQQYSFEKIKEGLEQII